jgi:integrase
MARYRAERRRSGLNLKPRRATRGRNTTDHLPRDYFRRHAWTLAVTAAGITGKVTFHDLRHTHATWLARDGVSIEMLRERLGHASLVTTQKYISASSRVDTTAAQAMAATDDQAGAAQPPPRPLGRELTETRTETRLSRCA